MVEYNQLTTVFSFTVWQSKVLLYCLSLCIFLVILVLPHSPPAHQEEEETFGLVYRGLCRPGLKLHGMAEVRVHTPTPNLSRLAPSGEGTWAQKQKGTKWQHRKTGNPKTRSASNHHLSLVPAAALESVNRSNGHLEYSEYHLWHHVSFFSSLLLICSCKVTVLVHQHSCDGRDQCTSCCHGDWAA